MAILCKHGRYQRRVVATLQRSVVLLRLLQLVPTQRGYSQAPIMPAPTQFPLRLSRLMVSLLVPLLEQAPLP